MESNDYIIDVESPKSVELSFAPSKEDEGSVATHRSDSDSDAGSASHSPSRRAFSLQKLALVAVLAAFIGLSVGLGVGLRVGDEESSRVIVTVSEQTQGAASDVSHRAESLVSNESSLSFTSNQDVGTSQPVYSLTAKVQAATSQPVVQNNMDRVSDDFDPFLVEEETVVEVITEESKPPAFTGTIGFGTSQSISWPQLVGLSGEEAKRIIEDEGNGYTVVIVPPGGVTTKDLRDDRVFLFVNDEGFVERVPRPGR